MDTQSQPDLKAYAERLEVLCRAQADEITRLRAQVAALTEGAGDAHATLRRLYLDETQNSNARIRAASAALNVEKASLKPQPAPLDLVAEEYEPLSVIVARQRARVERMQAEMQGKSIKVLSDGRVLQLDELSSNSGNGDSTGS